MKKKVEKELKTIIEYQLLRELLAIIDKFKPNLDTIKRIIRTIIHVMVLDYKLSKNKLKEYLEHIYLFKVK